MRSLLAARSNRSRPRPVRTCFVSRIRTLCSAAPSRSSGDGPPSRGPAVPAERTMSAQSAAFPPMSRSGRAIASMRSRRGSTCRAARSRRSRAVRHAPLKSDAASARTRSEGLASIHVDEVDLGRDEADRTTSEEALRSPEDEHLGTLYVELEHVDAHQALALRKAVERRDLDLLEPEAVHVPGADHGRHVRHRSEQRVGSRAPGTYVARAFRVLSACAT